MKNAITAVDGYDKKIFRITMSNLFGDRVNVQIPVKAAKRLIKAADRLPVMPKGINDAEMAQLLAAAEDCLDAEMAGDIVSMDTAEGMKVRIFVE